MVLLLLVLVVVGGVKQSQLQALETSFTILTLRILTYNSYVGMLHRLCGVKADNKTKPAQLGAELGNKRWSH